MRKQFGEYFLGLDVGTDSVGWSVTDLNYNLCKINGKTLCGVRLFDSGNTAAERRGFRSARRRNDRKIERISLLEELFATEVCKVDPTFFIRLKESKYRFEDKKTPLKYTLFNDYKFTDKEFFKEYPTISHLRKKLIDETNPVDIRLVYLAVAHILKNRGHFLFEGQDLKSVSSFKNVFENMNLFLKDEFDFCFNCEDTAELENILKSKGITAKKKKLTNLLNAQEPFEKAVIDLLSGASVDAKKLFGEDLFEEDANVKIKFAGGEFDEKYSEIEKTLQDKIVVVEAIKAVYDWAVLADILQGEKYLSYAKVKVFEKHKKDLALLKKIISEYCPEHYKEIFNNLMHKTNYASYIGMAKMSGKKQPIKESVCSQEDLCKYLEGKIKNITSEDEDFLYVKNELANRSLLPKQTSKDNGVIPYQVHFSELEAILENVSQYHSFLGEIDENGFSVKEKIKKLMLFRIPYYVGPLNDAHKGIGNCWIIKKNAEKVSPWNFENVVDIEASAEKFILKMTNKCTYLVGADVIPKNSLLYSKYMVLNELNNLKINNEAISIELKKEIFNNLFMKKIRVTQKGLKNYLISFHNLDKNIEISGIDGDFKATLNSYLDFVRIFPKGLEEGTIERIILSIVLFGDDEKLLERKIKSIVPNVTDNEIKAIRQLKYKGWGRLSNELLTGIIGVEKDTGEEFNLITALWGTNNNLMKLLSERFTFAEQVKNVNADKNGQKSNFSYEGLVEKLYVSPAIKRSIWQTLTIVQEIKKIMGHAPKKVFVEVAREEGEKKRTISRRNTLIDLYKKCKDEERDWAMELEGKTDDELRRDRLYLYYTQMGRCMYCDKEIEISNLYNANIYDVDHIFPQSKVKDDSLENRVLTHKICNANKSDAYPLPNQIRGNQHSFWKMLFDKKLIGKTKYDRLTRNTEFSDDELAGFIARQLVETRQSTKATAEVLQKIFPEPETEIVYVKAGNVSDFRKGVKCYPNQPEEEITEFVKVREINDYHHAKDAYLNIVVGNVYNTKFTHSPLNFIKDKATYNMRRMFEFDVKRGGIVAWRTGVGGTMATVEKVLRKNNILFTRYATESKGGLFDQMPVKKAKGLMPLKGSDPRLCDTEKYGGYNSIKGAYFILIEHIEKKNTVRTIEFVPIYLAKDIERDKSLLMEYCNEKLKLSQPKIIIDRIKINTLFNIDGFLMHLSSKHDENRLAFKNANQLIVDQKTIAYFKKIVKYIEKCKIKKETLQAHPFDKLTTEENLIVYNLFLEKLKNTVYNVRLSAQAEALEKSKNKFQGLSVGEQCKVLYEISKMLKCNIDNGKLKFFELNDSFGRLTMNKNISKHEKIIIINQSPTGVFEQVINLKTL